MGTLTGIIRSRIARDLPDARSYRGYADLARAQRLGVDFRIHVRQRTGCRIAVIAPHGGGIENGTSEIARAVAGEDLNLYLLEGLRPRHNYHALHLTSHLFDEPRCLQLIAGCSTVVAIHGCAGTDPQVYLGGRDRRLRDRFARILRIRGFPARTDGHRFPAARADNVCNRGATGMGVQVELSEPLRMGAELARIGAVLRAALL
ncbi:MAG: poly-gamma-glutamate hydrolase family protein [Gammaproteobacteria bacterium]|nr:poly-gamma-glutamate hydrolase family protein [Gammaproteobacteria bacterium]